MRPVLVLSAFLLLVFAYALVSRRLEATPLTAPIFFTLGGALLLLAPVDPTRLAAERESLLVIAELGLVMLLFTDASRIRRRALAGDRNLPVRLLTVGMLLTIALGALLAMVCLGTLTWWEAGIIAAILAPTDAGLGQVIVTSPRVPARIRQALNVEAGLNDGLSVPFLMLFIALAATTGADAAAHEVLWRYLLEQLGYGALIGLAVGLTGGWLLGLAQRRGWMSPPLAQLGVVALPLACFIASEHAGASMFIAAFVAGLASQVGFPQIGRHSVEFTEEWGQLFNFFVFLLFGLIVGHALPGISGQAWLYAVLSLTVVRMAPVALALAGTGLARSTVLFMGWFGPRGLASIVLGLVALEQHTPFAGESVMRQAVLATVLLSIFAHGLSARPAIGWYQRRVDALPPDAPEHAAPPPDAAQCPAHTRS
jgi:NhaP-type Na+/H+ or K+/H+ antiporter